MTRYRVMVFEKDTHIFICEFRTNYQPYYECNNGGDLFDFGNGNSFDLNKYYLIIDNK